MNDSDNHNEPGMRSKECKNWTGPIFSKTGEELVPQHKIEVIFTSFYDYTQSLYPACVLIDRANPELKLEVRLPKIYNVRGPSYFSTPYNCPIKKDLIYNLCAQKVAYAYGERY